MPEAPRTGELDLEHLQHAPAVPEAGERVRHRLLRDLGVQPGQSSREPVGEDHPEQQEADQQRGSGTPDRQKAAFLRRAEQEQALAVLAVQLQQMGPELSLAGLEIHRLARLELAGRWVHRRARAPGRHERPPARAWSAGAPGTRSRRRSSSTRAAPRCRRPRWSEASPRTRSRRSDRLSRARCRRARARRRPRRPGPGPRHPSRTPAAQPGPVPPARSARPRARGRRSAPGRTRPPPRPRPRKSRARSRAPRRGAHQPSRGASPR